jgi:hypothetical protein
MAAPFAWPPATAARRGHAAPGEGAGADGGGTDVAVIDGSAVRPASTYRCYRDSMRPKPDAEVDPPLLLKALGLLIGMCFSATAVLIARDALRKPFSAGSLLLVLVVVAIALTLFGLLVWRMRLYAEGDTILVERRGYFGTTRRTFATADLDLSLDRNATYGLLAKAVVPRFVIRTRDGEVLLVNQWMGVEQLAERLAKRIGRPLREA